MVRSIVSVILGCVVAGFLVFASFAVAQAMLGPEWLFRPGSFDPSKRWLVLSFMLGFLAALVGGVLCGALSKRRGAVLSLAAVLLVLGAANAAMVYANVPSTPPPPRTPTMPALEMERYATEPLWVAALNPLIGAIGVLLGGRVALRRK